MAKRASGVAARIAAGLLVCVQTAPVEAAFPGRNGVIVFADWLPGDDARSAIFSVAPDGTGLKQLTAGTAGLGESTPAVSPDGTRIVFGRKTGYVQDLWVMNIDGSEPRQLTFSSVSFGGLTKPAWSPDGTRIAFAATASSGIGVVNADGSDLRMLRTDNSDDPRWSPDGALLTFWIASLDGIDVYVMRPDGSDVRPLTTVPGDDHGADWSPDGTRLAFSSWRDGDFGDIYTMRADGSEQTRVVALPRFDVNPVWSPDGRRIAWEHCSRTGSDGDIGIYTANVDGSDLRKVVSTLSCTGNYPDWQALPGPRAVAIDVTPRDGDDVIPLHGRDAVEVAFLSQDGFDARQLDPRTACFGAADDEAARDCSPRRTGKGLDDVDGDGDLDLVLTFRGRETGLVRGATHACASARTRDGEQVEGCRDVEVGARACR